MLQCLRVHIKTMGSIKTMEDVDTTVTNPIIAVKEDVVHNTTGIGVEAMVVMTIVILLVTVGHTECVPIQENTAGPWKAETRRTHCGATRCREVSELEPDRLGRYLLIK